MSSREKDQADFDLEKFVDLFDTAMSSDNPTIQRALRNLLMIAAMVDAETANKDAGPLRRLVEDIKHLNRRISDMEIKQSWAPPAYPYNPPSTTTPNIPAGPYTTPIPGQPWWGTGTGPTLYQGGQGGTTTSTGYVQVNQGPTATSSTTTYTSLLNKLETK